MPRTWVKRTLGEVAHLSIGRTPPREQRRYWTDDLSNPFCTIADLSSQVVTPSREGVTDIAISEGKAKLAVKGTLLMSFKLTLGRLGFAGQDLYPNEAIVSIVPRTADVLDLYLFYLLGFQDLSAGSGRAVKGATLNSKSLAEIPLLLPPLEEQRRIVDLVSSVDTYIAALEQQADTARKARNAVLKELLLAGGDDWIETTLGDVAEYVNGFPFKPEHLGETGTPVIRIKQLLDPMEPLDHTTIEVPDRCTLSDGDVVFSWSGTLAVRIWRRGRAYLNQHLFRVLPGPNIEKNFLSLVLDHAIDELVEKSHGTTMKHITKQTLLPHEVHLPPLTEQQRIVDVVSSIDEVLESTEQAVADAKSLRSGLLSDLLSGNHEIPETYDQLLGAA